MAETVQMDPVTQGEDGATMDLVEQRFNRFENKNTFWRHAQNGTMDEFDRRYEEAVERLRGELGADLPLVIDGQEEHTDSTMPWASPADQDLVVAKAAAGTKQHVQQALDAAKRGFKEWSSTPWQERAAVLERTADLFTERFYDLCAIMTFETGKTRFESSIDVDEAIDFLRFYAFQMREMDGFQMTMGKPVPNETCTSVRRPYGVFAVMCPFNFPVAITTGMTAAALVTGNAAILKPSPKGCLAGHTVFTLFREAGVPAGALHFLTGPDDQVSQPLIESKDVDGIVFTGSKQIGLKINQIVADQGRPMPVITEMGGKNAVIVTDKADLDAAVEGCFKASFGFSGQKCSAGSRIYVHKAVAKEFTERFTALTEKARVGLPWEKESYMGPVIEGYKADLVVELAEQVRKDGGTVHTGGERVDLNGNYVRPTIVSGLPADHRVYREEFFAPFAAIHEFDDLDEAIDEANAVEYGLTAGVMSQDEQEVERFFDRIEAGVCYANRATGASTAAVVNGQSFGGWKKSGNTGNGAGGRYYLTQFNREQSRTVAS